MLLLKVAISHLTCLQWASENGCPWNEGTCAIAAAENGHLSCLQWARENGCDWNRIICTYAAARTNGHLSMLRWARENNGCPWDKSLVLLLLVMAISPASNGRERTAATGMLAHVRLLLVMTVPPAFDGRVTMDVPVQTNMIIC